MIESRNSVLRSASSDVGGRPKPTRDTYQARYARALGPLVGLSDVLALTQVFERRVDGSHSRGKGPVAVVAVAFHPHIDAEDVPFLQGAVVGKAMDRFGVYRGADRRWKTAIALPLVQ